MLATGAVWISPGQWGNAALFAFLMACLGGLVVNRATRSDVTFAFLAIYSALVLGRSVWLGEPISIPMHRLESGALLLFSFFMISDPMTAPNARRGRVAHAALVAAIAYGWQFELYRTNGLIWALFMAAPAVSLWDGFWPARKFEWSQNGGGDEPVSVSKTDARDVSVRGGDALRAA